MTRTAGAGGYTLDLRATATATVAATPGDASPTGDARPGDRFSLTGTAAPGRVATFLVPVPAAARLVVGAADGGVVRRKSYRIIPASRLSRYIARFTEPALLMKDS